MKFKNSKKSFGSEEKHLIHVILLQIALLFRLAVFILKKMSSNGLFTIGTKYIQNCWTCSNKCIRTTIVVSASTNNIQWSDLEHKSGRTDNKYK